MFTFSPFDSFATYIAAYSILLFLVFRSHERKAEVDKVEQKLQEARAEKARERGMAPVDEWKQAPTVAGLDVAVLMSQVQS